MRSLSQNSKSSKLLLGTVAQKMRQRTMGTRSKGWLRDKHGRIVHMNTVL